MLGKLRVMDLIIKLKSGQVLSGLAELSLLHPLPNKPVDKGPLLQSTWIAWNNLMMI